MFEIEMTPIICNAWNLIISDYILESILTAFTLLQLVTTYSIGIITNIMSKL